MSAQGSGNGPVVALTGAQVSELLAASASVGGVHDRPAFSCNTRGELWPTPGRGLSQPGQRRLLPANTGTDALVRAVLSTKHRGGRFHLARGQVIDADTGSTLARLVRA